MVATCAAFDYFHGLRSCDMPISWLDHKPHAIAVYASLYCGPVLRHPAEPYVASRRPRWPSMAGWQALRCHLPTLCRLAKRRITLNRTRIANSNTCQLERISSRSWYALRSLGTNGSRKVLEAQ